MSKPIIGITGNEREIPDDHFIHMSYTATGFVEGVKEVGGIPMILPIGDDEMAKQYVSIVDKLIITGGQNVCPQFYGEEKAIDSDDYLLKRDIFELALIKEARRQNKPIFTVCRGTQLYNVALGGTLHQDIEDHWQDSSAEYTTQSMVTKNGSILHEIYGPASEINSPRRRGAPAATFCAARWAALRAWAMVSGMCWLLLRWCMTACIGCAASMSCLTCA